ncbi:tetratricopeptide repeat protein [Azospirillum rugosum]|uniref:Zn-dependent protease n=1 Tax=Azospirillum rugosum TaxID=416170 RepID=A0ABS4SD83_9PROT|nr:tetratricopeptide repeat protein [Azospirillum rugosum]MBP2290535.1 putative Zn-dependent protease [Azospirillum rugosum]MDQ0525423.1 putative Zn-dependent protease [Azospirillum rugosum]
MRANILFVLLIIAVGVGVSLLLIPRGEELALQKFRDQDYATARLAYEQRFDAGDHSAATVMPLTRLYLDGGEVDRAIALMEAFVAREPEANASYAEGRQILSRLYRDAQRMGDYLENLEVLARLRPTDENYRELATLAGFHGQIDRQIDALRRYCELRPEDGDAQMELGTLLASQGAYAEAMERLGNADDRAKGAIEPNGRELLMSLLLDQGRAGEAYARARQWIALGTTVGDTIGLLSQFAAANRPDLSVKLLEPKLADPARPLALELTHIDLLTAAGRVEEARARLDALPDAVDDLSLGRLVALQMNVGLGRKALETAKGRDLNLIPDWALVGMAETAFRERDNAFLEHMTRELGDAVLAQHPVLAANIAIARGDKGEAARHARAALADAALPLAEHLAAVRLLDRAGQREAAAAAFDRLALTGALPDEVLEELGGLFLDLDRAKAGVAWFDARRAAMPSLAGDLGWVRLAAKAGDPGRVASWLDAHPRLDPALLQDVAGIAAERGASVLALKAAERVYAAAPTPRSRFALASALLSAKRPADALPHLTDLLADGGAPVEPMAVESAYAAALGALGRNEELARFVAAKLNRGSLREEEETALLYTLLDLKAYRPALPFLRDRARRLGGEWLFAYADAARKTGAVRELADLLEADLARPDLDAKGREDRAGLLLDVGGPARALPVLKQLASGGEARWDGLYRDALTKLGRKDELRRHLAARAHDDRVPAKERREIAFALLDQGDKASAEQALLRLAAGQGPDSADFKQLTFLWGPRPAAAALDWIEGRAKGAASPAEQAAWYERLADLGGARRVADRLGQGGAPAAKDLKGPYIEALAAQGKGKELAEAVKSAVGQEREPERLRRYARLAEQARQRGAAAEAWKAVLSQRPDDGDALRQLGMLAYDENRLADAERFLRGFLAQRPGDYEANYFLGESLTGQKRPAEAVPFYRRALEQVRALKAKSDNVVQTEANILHRLGKVDDAVVLFETLRKLRPADRQLKADYASMLIDSGRMTEARRVLNLP